MSDDMSDDGPSLTERVYALESHVATLAHIVARLITYVGIVNSYRTLDDKGVDDAKLLEEAKSLNADLGNLLQDIEDTWPAT